MDSIENDKLYQLYDYILEDGQHEAIIDEELWNKVHAKRVATGIKQPSKVAPSNWTIKMPCLWLPHVYEQVCMDK